jgi:ABC-2 type transport system ATP-binding protein
MPEPAPVIRAGQLTKLYGRDRGVLDLDFEVRAGEVFGFLGPNGAGKTTTIRLILDLIRPTRGRIEVFGCDPRRNVSLRRRIGYLPGDLRLYEHLTARELCVYFGHLRGLAGPGRAERIAERLELPLDRSIGSLSKGNRQKVGLVQAFMHEPDLFVLDEPFYHYAAGEPLRTGMSTGHVGLLILLACLAAVAAAVAFDRRELSTP